LAKSALIKRNVIEEVRALKAQDGKQIVIDGSSVLVHTLAQHDLVDKYSLLMCRMLVQEWCTKCEARLRRSVGGGRIY
jgi:dihydrofolate reductase